jgi:hypothetical protein
MSKDELDFSGSRNSIANILRLLAVISFFLFFFISFLTVHVANNDFWWHLATGKYIVQHHSLPQIDPFAYTAHAESTAIKSAVLKGNWLSQVVFYAVFSGWDLKGIIILRSLLLTFFLLLIYLTVKKQGLPDLLSLPLVTGVFFVAITFTGERPQLFTFFIFSLVMYLLEDYRVTGSRKILFVPVATLLLSNMHHGYIVCILLISVYLLGEGISQASKRSGPANNRRFILLFGVWIFSLILSFLNPSNFSIFGALLFYKEVGARGIVEFMPTLSVYAEKLGSINYVYIGFLILSLFSLRYPRKIGLVNMLVLVTFTVMSLVSLRYMIFYMCAAAPILARVMLCAKDEMLSASSLGMLRTKEGFLYGLFFIMGAFLVFSEMPVLAAYEFRANTSFAAPQKAADFLKSHKIYGNMFNEYGFGGYLIWRLYPEKKVFIDGRDLEDDVHSDYNVIGTAKSEEGRHWTDLIEKYGITYIVMPPLTVGGEIIPLVEKMFDMNEWVLIYSDNLALIFLKKDDNNMQLVCKYAKDKTEGLQTVVIQAAARAMTNPGNPRYFISLGKVFFKMNKIDEAEKAFNMAYKIDPDNAVVKEYLKVISGQEDTRLKQ